jgi:CPA2 family monovalent cation:H+ antiporter-2
VLARGEFSSILVSLATDAGLDGRPAPFVAVSVLVPAVASPVLAAQSPTVASLPQRFLARAP